jgi:hypothetical protein
MDGGNAKGFYGKILAVQASFFEGDLFNIDRDFEIANYG